MMWGSEIILYFSVFHCSHDKGTIIRHQSGIVYTDIDPICIVTIAHFLRFLCSKFIHNRHRKTLQQLAMKAAVKHYCYRDPDILSER